MIEHISFSSAAYYLFYHIGVIKALQEKYPKLHKKVSASGCSVGAWMATLYLVNMPADKIFDEFLIIISENGINIGDACREYFDKNIIGLLDTKIISRIKISYTDWSSLTEFKNQTTCNFESINDFREKLFASAYLPIIMGKNLTYNKKLDGVFHNTQPIFCEKSIHKTLIVSTSRHNINATIRPSTEIKSRYKLFKPSKEQATELFLLGYSDALIVLNNLTF